MHRSGYRFPDRFIVIPETLRGRYSALLATASVGPDILRNVLIRPETFGRFLIGLTTWQATLQRPSMETPKAPVQHEGQHFPRGYGRTVPHGIRDEAADPDPGDDPTLRNDP